ncbi:MAG TPA: hypothetical protein VHE23_01835 [Candidatus Acidoferrales bacterium]|nr:hypothetical protein [Candidatus Acidoferrales bacterium]
MRALLIGALLCAAVAGLAAAPAERPAVGAAGSAENYLYRVELVQAAPGRLLELIELLRTQAALVEAAGDTPPFWMRHSQGDRWDLLLLYPMGSYMEYYSAERVARRVRAENLASIAARIQLVTAWQEDVFMFGPQLDALKAAFANAGFFHVEMMHALPGKLSELRTERDMESAYQKQLHRPELFIFVRDQGAAWDILSIDFYRDLKHYSESADIPAEQQEASARAAGFPSASQIGPYLRTLIASHHDTLAVAISPASKK